MTIKRVRVYGKICFGYYTSMTHGVLSFEVKCYQEFPQTRQVGFLSLTIIPVKLYILLSGISIKKL